MTNPQTITFIILSAILMSGLIFILIQCIVSKMLMKGEPSEREEETNKNAPWPELFITVE